MTDVNGEYTLADATGHNTQIRCSSALPADLRASRHNSLYAEITQRPVLGKLPGTSFTIYDDGKKYFSEVEGTIVILGSTEDQLAESKKEVLLLGEKGLVALCKGKDEIILHIFKN